MRLDESLHNGQDHAAIRPDSLAACQFFGHFDNELPESLSKRWFPHEDILNL